jgi:hypothetical protein
MTVMARLPSFLLGVPISDGLDLSASEALGDAVHHGCGLLPGLKGLHLGDDVGGLPTNKRRDGRVDVFGGMTA